MSARRFGMVIAAVGLVFALSPAQASQVVGVYAVQGTLSAHTPAYCLNPVCFPGRGSLQHTVSGTIQCVAACPPARRSATIYYGIARITDQQPGQPCQGLGFVDLLTRWNDGAYANIQVLNAYFGGGGIRGAGRISDGPSRGTLVLWNVSAKGTFCVDQKTFAGRMILV